MPNKKYDWMALLQYQPDYSLVDFKEQGITPDNTEFKSRDYYKNLQDVQTSTLFQNEDGNFDEKKFNKFYDSAAILYNNYANEEVFASLAGSKTYDPWAWWNDDSTKMRDTSPKLQIGDENIPAITRSIKAFGVNTETPFSTRELAQRRNYFDSETGKWSDKKPNDFAGFFKSWTAPELVLATYEEDTVEPDNTGKMIEHKKGEIKLDNGLPYYRTLRKDEDASGKDFLLREDIISVDGSSANKFDIFDSDGKRTEGWKVAAHTIARIVPYLLPYVGKYYAYLMAAKNIAAFMPQFLKTVDGVITNDALSNEFGQTMNYAVGWMKRLDHGVSDYSREHLVTWENAGKMFADITGQLFEQKSMQNITQLFKSPAIRNNPGLAKALSYGYMATTSADEAYDIMKQAGANDRTAGLAMWALIGVYYNLMNANYYKHALFKDSWIDEEAVKSSARKLADLYKSEIAINPEMAGPTKEAAAKTTNWFMRQWEKLLGTSDKLESAGILGGKTWASKALSEGVEEVTEEIGIDAIKGLTKALEALGVNVGDQPLNFGFSAEDVLQRYGMSFAGGAFGGAVFHGYNLLDKNYRNSFRNEKIPESVLGDIVTLVMQNRQGEIYEQLAKDHKAKIWASPDLSATKFSVVRDVDGEVVAFEGADNGISQNDMVYNEAYKTVKFFEDLLSSEKFKDAIRMTKEAMKIGDEQAAAILMGQGVNVGDSAQNLILNDLKDIATNIASTITKMKVIEDRLRPTDQEGGDVKLKERLAADQEYQKLVQELTYWRNERDRIYDKKEVSKYMGQASIALNSSMMKAFLGFNSLETYASVRFQKPYTELSDEQRHMAKAEYNSYFDGENPGVFKAFHIYNELSKRFKLRLLEKDERLKSVVTDSTVKPETVGSNILKKRARITFLGKAIAEVSAKEGKTPDDERNIENWTKELEKLNTELSQIDQIEDDKLITREHTDDFKDFSLFDFANSLVELYKQSQGKHKYDDADLDRFLSRVKQDYGINTIMAKLDNYINERAYSPDILSDEGIGYMKEHGIENQDDFLWNPISSIGSELKDLIESYYNKLIDVEESKKVYDNIINLLKNRAKLTDEEIQHLLFEPIDETIGDPNLTVIPYFGRPLPEIMQEINEFKKNITYGDAIDLVKDFVTLIKDETLVPIIDILTQEELRMIKLGTKEYTIGNEFYINQFKHLSSILDVLSAIVGGAYDGTNEFLNPYRRREELEEYATISQNTGKLLQDDLTYLKNRITTLLTIDRYNSGQKLKEQKEIGANMRKKMLAKITSDVYIEDFKKKFNGIDLEQLMNDSTSPDFNLNEVTVDNYAEKEPEIIKFETALFNEIKKLGLSEEDIITKLVEIYGDDTLYKTQSTKLTKDPAEKVTAYDTILYAATVMSLNSNDFYVLYNDAIKRAKEIDPEFNIVPVYGQEYALRLSYAYAKNMSLFNGLLDKIAITGKNISAYQAKRRILYNMINVFGGASTGKTRGVAAMLQYLFPDASFRFLAPTDVQVKTLLSVFNEKEDSEKGSTVDDFITKIAPKIDDASNIAFDKDTKVRSIKNNTAQEYDWYGDASLKVMVIDESAMNNSIRLKALSEYAQKHNILIVALGDPNQNTAKLKYEVSTSADGNTNYAIADDGYEDCVSINTPYLTANFRSAYRSKVDNYSALLGTLISTTDKLFETGKLDPELQDYNDALGEVLGGAKIMLKYYRNNKVIAGDFITKDNNDFQTLLDNALASGSSVLLITDNSTNGKYVADKYKETDKFKRQSATEAQGGEYDYVFIDKAVETPSETSDEYGKLKDLYTLTQRSRRGSVILAQNDEYNRYVMSDPDPSSMGAWEMSPEQRSEYEKWRMVPLSALVPSDQFDENIRIGENVESPTPEEEEQEHNAGETPTPPTPTPEEEPEPKKDDGEPAEEPEIPAKTPEVEEPDNEPAGQDPAIPIVKPVEAVKEKHAEEEKKVAEKLVSWEEGRKHTNTNGEKWLEDVPKEAFEATAFFNSVFTMEFFQAQKDDETSMYNFFKKNGITLTEKEYQDLIMWFSRKALQNDFSFVKDGELNTVGHHALQQVLNRLNKEKAHSVQGKIVTKGDLSEIRIVVSDGTNYGTLFEVPIMSSPTIMQEGVINLDGQKPFVIYGRPWYNKAKGERAAIGVIKKENPWLQWIKTAGTVKPRVLAEYLKIKLNDIPNDLINAVRFVKDGLGHTYTIVYGIRKPKVSSVWQTTRDENNDMYLGTDKNITSRVGIQRLYTDTDVLLKISAALDYLLNFTYDKSDNYTETFLGLNGKISDNKKHVTDLLTDLTSNQEWKSDTIVKGSGIEYFSAIRTALQNSSIISDEQNLRVVADLFGELLRNPENHKNDWYKLHSRFHNIMKRSMGLLIRLDPTHEYILCSEQSEGLPNKISLYRTKYNEKTNKYDHSFVELVDSFETSGNPQAFTENVIRVISNLLNSFEEPLSLEDFNSNIARVGFVKLETTDGGIKTYEEFSINNWVSMFSDFSTSGALSSLLNQDKFKHGLFAQFPATDQYDNSEFAESIYDDNDTTTAREWHAEMILLNATPVKVENISASEAAATQGYALSLLSDIKNAASKLLPEDSLTEILQKYEDAIKNTVDLNDIAINAWVLNLVTEINNTIKNSAVSYGYSILNINDNNNIQVITDPDWKTHSYKNLIESTNSSIGETLNYVYENKISLIDVVQAIDNETNKPVYFVFHPKEGTLVAIKTVLFEEWDRVNSVYKTIANTILEASPGYKSDLRNIQVYLYSLLTGDTTESIMNNYVKSVSNLEGDITTNRLLNEIQEEIVNYLISRIEHDEC